jgi:hypothetical protein
MKTLKLLIFTLILAIGVTSCLLDQDSVDYSDSVSVLGFAEASRTLTYFNDIGDQTVTIVVRLDGPQKYNFQDGVSASVSVDPASTAVAGQHYELGNANITLSEDSNYFATFPLTIKTDGIDPSEITENPKLILSLDNISDSSVLLNGRAGTSTIEIIYVCPSDLGGEYSYTNPAGCSDTATVTDLGNGAYEVSTIPVLNWSSGACIPFNMIENCGELFYQGGELEANGYATESSLELHPDGSFTYIYSIPSLGYGPFESLYTPL